MRDHYPDPVTALTFLNTVRTYKALVEDIEHMRRRFGHVDLHPSEIHALVHMQRNADCNFTELAEGLLITKRAFTEIAAKLEPKGLVGKYHRSDDRKSVYFKLTNIGKESVQAHETSHRQVSFTMADEHKQFIEDNASTIERFLSTRDEIIADVAGTLRKVDTERGMR